MQRSGCNTGEQTIGEGESQFKRDASEYHDYRLGMVLFFFLPSSQKDHKVSVWLCAATHQMPLSLIEKGATSPATK